MITHEDWEIVQLGRRIEPAPDGTDPGGMAPASASVWYRRKGEARWTQSPERSLHGTKRYLGEYGAEGFILWQLFKLVDSEDPPILADMRTLASVQGAVARAILEEAPAARLCTAWRIVAFTAVGRLLVEHSAKIDIVGEIAKERLRQVEKWTDAPRDPLLQLAVLGEEVGEVDDAEDLDHEARELIQVAAVAVKGYAGVGAERWSTGKRIASMRKARGVKQEDLAEKLGIHRNTVIRWEGDHVTPRTLELERIASVLGVPAMVLIP